MASDESHFNVSLIVRDHVHKPQLWKRKESRSGIEPRSFRLPAKPALITGKVLPTYTYIMLYDLMHDVQLLANSNVSQSSLMQHFWAALTFS